MNKRPAGITLLAILFFILGGLSLLWSGLIFGVGGLSSLFGGLFGAEQVAAYGQSTAWSGFFGVVTAFVQIIVGFGLLGMQKWAWVLALIGAGLTVLQGVVGIINGGAFAFMCGSIGLIIPIIIFIYLLSSGTRRIFGMQA
ncbi:MAG: hypothetical protein ACK2UW_12100 [Anaerolineales bacterium]|jgi:hypothetical protein